MLDKLLEEAVNTLFRANLWHARRLPRRHGGPGPDVKIDLPYSNFAYDQRGTPWPVNQSVYVDYMLHDLRGYHAIAAEELSVTQSAILSTPAVGNDVSAVGPVASLQPPWLSRSQLWLVMSPVDVEVKVTVSSVCGAAGETEAGDSQQHHPERRRDAQGSVHKSALAFHRAILSFLSRGSADHTSGGANSGKTSTGMS